MMLRLVTVSAAMWTNSYNGARYKLCVEVMVKLDSERDTFTPQRERMVASQLRGRDIRDERVLDAMARVPRDAFVPVELRSEAYEDRPLPIGNDQTISQPYIVALMLEDLHLSNSDKVLEIGTGSGYQAALLGELAAQVYTIERHPALANTAASVLAELGYKNVTVVTGDGTLGLPDKAPFDAIIVAAAAPEIPSALFAQLREGGRMIIPVGSPHAQELKLMEKRDSRLQITNLEGCRFVPLVPGVASSDEEENRLGE
ncbi:MAG TPA: protein-L-isoaspartate(D-aspartate) O-methyltransferase [Terriglobales bacterium]|nr:protein-L-isoaspartate(D-aspartate) O-methyltransferase [Terriglobales bacterium]